MPRAPRGRSRSWCALGLQTKFILCVALILVAVMTSGGVWFYQHQEAEFYDRVGRDMELTQAFLDSARAYAHDLEPPGEAKCPTVTLRGVLDRLAAARPQFRF